LDRIVYDPLSNDKEGGLEVKCPFSKQNMSIEEACQDTKFYLQYIDGKSILKRNHKYFFQVQGQMYVCQLKWVDFVVWFGADIISIERIPFEKEWWKNKVLPKLLYFYKRAFLPEVLTRRVKRGIPLYKDGGWVSFPHSKKLRSS